MNVENFPKGYGTLTLLSTTPDEEHIYIWKDNDGSEIRLLSPKCDRSGEQKINGPLFTALNRIRIFDFETVYHHPIMRKDARYHAKMCRDIEAKNKEELTKEEKHYLEKYPIH